MDINATRIRARVVAFIVNVKLVEKRVNRKVGIVIVQNVISQYRIPGITLIMNRAALPSIAIHEREGTAFAISCPVDKANDAVGPELMLLDRLVTLCMAFETVSGSDILQEIYGREP